MTFIITLIALLMERFLHWHHLRHWNWFFKVEQRLNAYTFRLPTALTLAIDLLLPVLLVGLVGHLLSGWFYGILELAFGVVVLLYCLGSENLWVQGYRCIQDLAGGDKAALSDYVNKAFGVTEEPGSQAFHKALVSAIFIAAHQRIFAVVFWFVILGPMGAVLYRLVELLSSHRESGVQDQAGVLLKLLDWVPVRLFTFIFALGGHFTQVFTCWKKNVIKGPEANGQMLAECGIAALDVMEGDHMLVSGEAEVEALELLDRVFVMALILLAFVVMFV